MVNVNMVDNLFRDCIIEDSNELENNNDVIIVNGLLKDCAFSIKKIKEHRELIRTMLGSLSDEYLKGMSYVNMCYDRYGIRWANDNKYCEELMELGIAAGFVVYSLPKSLWYVLPHGLPYLYFKF